MATKKNEIKSEKKLINLTKICKKLLESKKDSEIALAEICKKDYPGNANIVYAIVAKLLVYISNESGVNDEKILLKDFAENPMAADALIYYAESGDTVTFNVSLGSAVLADWIKEITGRENVPVILKFKYTRNEPAVFLGCDTTQIFLKE